MSGGASGPTRIAGLAAGTARELAPLLRRTIALDPAGLARVRVAGRAARVLVRLPFDVLIARAVTVPAGEPPLDATVAAAELLAWIDGTRAEPPSPRDADWRGGSPPESGWRRVETVPDEVVRGLVRSGALALRQAAEREGVPGAQPRAEVADALLNSVVLTVSDEASGASAEVSLRTLSALTRMGFLPRESQVAVAVCGRWTRVAAVYGSVFAERAGLGVLRP